jgi:2-methylcitrate dehydratase PrpD
MNIGKEIAEYIVHTELSDIPADVAEIAKRCFMDWLGVTLAGASSELEPVVRGYLSSFGNDGPATLLGSGRTYDVLNAAFGNGVYSHALDFDDYHMTTVLHTTPPTLPALLAAAEYSDSSGKDILTAVVLALDATLRLGKGVKRVHYNRGWHITSTIGRFGAVAGVAKLMGLSADAIIDAIGIAATSAGGLRNVFGTMSKPFHAGKAAMDGLMACLLARSGMDSASDIFDGRHGFFDLFTEAPDHEVITDGLGKEFLLSEISYKTYPAPL